MAWTQREDTLCDALNNILDGRPGKALEVLGVTATAFDRMRAVHKCYRKLSNVRLKKLNDNWSRGMIEVDGEEAITFKAGMSPASLAPPAPAAFAKSAA